MEVKFDEKFSNFYRHCKDKSQMPKEKAEKPNAAEY